jgi:DNA-binding Lrp family transcriptional regulator
METLYIVQNIYYVQGQCPIMTLIKLDDKDLKIIEHLKQNARISVRDLGKKAKIRPSTVHQRIKRLVDNGVVQSFTIKLDPEKMGENLTVFMLVSGSLDKYFDDRFLKSKQILEIHGITGEYDLLLKLRFKDMKQFNKFVIDFRERYSRSISKTITMVETVRLKE